MKFSAGLQECEVSESEQGLKFPVLVMYPTDTPSEETRIGPYKVKASPQAPIAGGKFPLVVISHGSGSSKEVFRHLAGNLAENGFIVAMPEHPFNNRHNNEHSGTAENLRDRPRHVRKCIDWLLATAPWKDHALSKKVALVGHSLGGYTALALAGGVPHTKHQIQHDPQTKLTRSEQIAVEPDSRIQAIVLLAPATGWFASEGALAAVQIPVLILSGEFDTITPLFHADIVKRGVPDPSRVLHRVVENANHFSFLGSFPPSMRTSAFPPAFDREGFDREAFHVEMDKIILGFIEKHLRK